MAGVRGSLVTLVVPLLGLVTPLAGCSSSEETDDVSTSTAGGASSDPRPAAPSTTEQPELDGEEEQAAAMAALEAYDSAWAVLVQSYRDPGAKPDWELDYRQYMTEPELGTALAYVYGLRDAQLAHPSGTPVRNPTVTSVDLEAQIIEVRDCVDLSQWPQVSTATGMLNATPQPPYVVTARVVYEDAAGRWLVSEQTPETSQPC